MIANRMLLDQEPQAPPAPPAPDPGPKHDPPKATPAPPAPEAPKEPPPQKADPSPAPPAPPAPPEPPKPDARIDELTSQVERLTGTLRHQAIMSELAGYEFAKPEVVARALGDHPGWFDGHTLTDDGKKALKIAVDEMADGYARTTDHRRRESTPPPGAGTGLEEMQKRYSGDGVIPFGKLPTDSYYKRGR